MNQKQYFRALDKASDEYHKSVDALGVCWRLIHGTEPPVWPAKNRESALGTAARAIREVIQDMPEEFSTKDVAAMVSKVPEFAETTISTVSHTLKRLANRKSPMIAVVQIGKGKTPTKYRKMPPRQ